MIAECIIFLATLGSLETPNDEYMLEQYQNCWESVPESMHQYADLYYKFFDEDNISTAVRIGWCESRGKQNAYRSDNGDSGVMQFVSWTWNWVAEKYYLPYWDYWQIFYKGEPYYGKTSRSSINFSQEQVQYSPYYNLLFASILAEDIYGKTQWRDWSSSEWCWGDEEKWERLWKKESRSF